jgi:hypothetical protein
VKGLHIAIAGHHQIFGCQGAVGKVRCVPVAGCAVINGLR